MSELKIKVCVLGMVSTNCYIVYKEPENREEGVQLPAVIIDPADNVRYITKQLNELNLKLEAILLTHGHFDHIMAADSLRQAYQVPIIACEKEKELLADPQMNGGPMIGASVSLEADQWVHGGDVLELLGMKWKVLYTPGHTIGSVCYYLEEEHVLFSGDTLFCQSYGRTDLATGSSRQLMQSIIQILFKLPDETNVCPGHEDMTTIGFEKKRNPIAYYMR